MLGIALNLIAATVTGIAMDRGRDIGLANAELVALAYADDDYDKHGEKEEGLYEKALEETHEFFSNLFLIFVGMHVSYLFLFKRPLAKFMLFIPKNK